MKTLQKTLLILVILTFARSDPVKLIIDTDMGFDVDDVGSVCMANALHDLGEVDILAIVHDTGFSKGVGAISSINNYYGHDFTIGAYKGPFGDDQNAYN